MCGSILRSSGVCISKRVTPCTTAPSEEESNSYRRQLVAAELPDGAFGASGS